VIVIANEHFTKVTVLLEYLNVLFLKDYKVAAFEMHDVTSFEVIAKSGLMAYGFIALWP